MSGAGWASPARAFVAERYSWQENARQMEALYQELLEHAEKA